ncbi:MAG: acyl-CoA dehydrogenase family protein [Ilumatobacteraceae bacterium]
MKEEEKGYSTMLAAMLLTEPETIETTYQPELTPAWPVDDLSAFRERLTQWIDESWDTSIRVREWWRRLADAGLTMPTWPRTAGGISAPTAIQRLIERELAGRGLIGPPVGGAGLREVGPALRQHGTGDQRERFLDPLMRGECTWCVLLEEHDADLSDIETRATGDATAGKDTFQLSGGKVWTRDVAGADWAIVLAVTDRKAHVKRRMTCFAVDLRQDAISVDDPGRRPRLVKLDQAIAERRDAIGGVGAGWAVAQTVLAYRDKTLAGRIRRGVVSVAPGVAAGNLDMTVAEAIASFVPRPKRKSRRDEPGSERRQRPDLT